MAPRTEKEHVANSYQSSVSSEESLYTSPPEKNTLPHHAVPTTVLKALSDDYLIVREDGLVDFAYASPSHPRQWSLPRKLYDTTIICLLEFVTTVISNAGSNIAEQVGDECGISHELAIFCTATLYLLGQAIGGLIFPPVAEVFGSRILYAGSTALYAAMCLMTGLAPSLATVITGRLFCGMLSAMPTCVATGSVENIWDSRARIWGIASWAAAGVFAMSIGPLYAVYVSDSQLGWPWVFILAGIVCGVLSLLCFTMQESRPAQVLRQRVRKIEKSTQYTELRIEGASLPTLGEFARGSLTLPIRLFVTEPIVLVCSIMGSTVVSLTYLFAEAIPVVYSHDFGMTRNQSALIFLIMGAGVLFFILPRLCDIRMANHRHRRHQTLQPEDKLAGFLAAAPLLAIGLWWFGATIPPMVPKSFSPAVSLVPVAFVGFAAVEFDTVLAGYLTDVYNSHAASANAPMCFLRALMSGCYPLFGRQMFEGLGSSGASFILAGMATAYVGVAFCFWKYGRTIRRKSKFAEESRIAGDVDADD